MTGPANATAVTRQFAIAIGSFGLTAMLIFHTVQGSGVIA